MKRRTYQLKKMTIFDYFNYAFMTLFCLSIFIPMWNVFTISLMPSKQLVIEKFTLWPENAVLDAYKYALSENTLLRAFGISVFRVITGTVLHLFVISIAAYPLTKTKLPYRKLITLFFLIPMFISAGLIASFIINVNLGLRNNILVYILPSAFSMYNTIILRNYLFSIDAALEEAALIDGANHMKVLLDIIIPLSKPVLATIALWVMVSQWNAWFDAMIYMTDDNLIPVQLVLQRMLKSLDTISDAMKDDLIKIPGLANIASKQVQYAMTMLVILPIMCIYPFLQKYFVKGIMLGSVKG